MRNGVVYNEKWMGNEQGIMGSKNSIPPENSVREPTKKTMLYDGILDWLRVRVVCAICFCATLTPLFCVCLLVFLSACRCVRYFMCDGWKGSPELRQVVAGYIYTMNLRPDIALFTIVARQCAFPIAFLYFIFEHIHTHTHTHTSHSDCFCHTLNEFSTFSWHI